jgi:uncharacterized repeat protein (TIGR03847 family)
MARRDLEAALITVYFRGEPGRREFFIQVRNATEAVTMALEKQQVSLLAEKLSEILLVVDSEDPVVRTNPARDPALDPVPAEPEGRIASVGLAYDEDDDRVVIVFEPVAEGVEDPPEPGEGPDSVRVIVQRDQVRAFVLHALGVVGEGRPLCQLCGLPMDPDGHACPSSNGHHPSG